MFSKQRARFCFILQSKQKLKVYTWIWTYVNDRKCLKEYNKIRVQIYRSQVQLLSRCFLPGLCTHSFVPYLAQNLTLEARLQLQNSVCLEPLIKTHNRQKHLFRRLYKRYWQNLEYSEVRNIRHCTPMTRKIQEISETLFQAFNWGCPSYFQISETLFFH